MRGFPLLKLSTLLCVILLSANAYGGLRTDNERLQQAITLMQQNKTAAALRAIGPLKSRNEMTPAYGRLAFLRAILMQKIHGTEASLDAFNFVWRTYPPLADYAAVPLAEAAAERGDLAKLETLVNHLMQRYPYSRHLPSLNLLLAEAQHRLGSPQKARETVARILRIDSPHAATPGALFLRAQLDEEAGRIAQAATAFMDLGETYARHPRAGEAFQRSRKLLRQLPAAQRPPMDPKRALNALDSLIKARHWIEVKQRLKALAPRVQNSDLHARFLLLSAVAAQRQRRGSHAVTQLKRLLIRYPQSAERAEAHYRLALRYRRQGQKVQGETHLRHAIALRHDDVWAPKAALKLAQILEHQKELAKASELYHHLGKHYPSHEEAVPSLWRAAWLQYRLGHYDRAERMWRHIAKQFPEDVWRPKVLYWLARTVEHRGDVSNAQALYRRVMIDYPYTYHGFQAREQLRRLEVFVPPFAAQERPYLPWEQRPPVIRPPLLTARPTREQFHLIRLREFQHLQLYRRARPEIRALEALLPPTPATQYFVAGLLADNQQRLATFQRLNRLVADLSPLQIRGLTRDFWSLLYPQHYQDIVTRQADKYGLSPYLVFSLIRQESAFNPYAKSSVGARGLMQLMPATARHVARRTGRKRPALRQLYHPPTNIALGTNYFATQLRDFDHNPVFALAAYNAGPHRIQIWRKRWPDLPMDEFIEHIPFKETRLYVKLILRNLFVYESLYRPMPDA